MNSDELKREEQQILEFSSIAWTGYCSAGLIDEHQLKLIEAFDKQDKKELMAQNGGEYAHLLLHMLKKIGKPETVKYLLCLIDIALNEIPEAEPAFIATSEIDQSMPAEPFLKFVTHVDDFISYKSSKILTGLLVSGAFISESFFNEYMDFIINGLKDSNILTQQISLTCLQNLLLRGEYRLRFFNAPHGNTGVTRLIDVLKSKPNYQIQYHVIFSLWLFSFSEEISSKLEQWRVVSLLMETIKNSIKEKVIRVALSTLRNLLQKSPSTNLLPMLDNKLLPLLNSLIIRKWADDDIVEDIEFLTEELKKNAHELSSFEEYAAEVRSGKLEWSPVHKSEAFWKQNIFKFHEQNYELLRTLYRYLTNVTDPTVTAIAIHDLGEYARAFPQGKKVLAELGAKGRIIELMSHQNSEISYEALLAVQKLMVVNWEYLAKTKQEK